MPSRTGTASQVNASAGNGSTTVTVPADCNLIVAFWAHWDGNSGTTLSSLTLNGVGFTIHNQLAEGAVTNENGVGVATIVSPATGSQTFAWTWSAGTARTEGGGIILVYVTGANTSDPVRSTDVNSTIAGNDCSVTFTTVSTDLVLAMAERYYPGFSDPSVLDGTVFINDWILNANYYDASQVTAGASSTTINMTNENYSCMAAIALKEASAATKARPFRRSPLLFMPRRF